MDHIIIAIGRQHGSGGRQIAQQIANKLQIKFYDVRILMDIAKELNMDLDPGELHKYDEAPKRFGSRRIRKEFTNSVEDILAYKQFEYLKEKVESGESFVVLGRCADRVLKDFDGLIKVFITASLEKRVERISVRYNVEKTEAEKIIHKTDKSRKHYYEHHSGGVKWGDSTWHDIIIHSDTLGVEKTADFLVDFITAFQNKLQEEEK